MDTLRRQLPYLFMEGLCLREQLKDLKLASALAELKGKSLRLLWEKPIGWEFKLFSSVLADELKLDQKVKWDLAYGLKLGRIIDLGELPQVVQWAGQKLNNIVGLVQSVDPLVNKALQEAFKEPGVPGDPELIVYVARTIAQVRRELLMWTIDFNCTEVRPECKRLIVLISDFSQNVIEQLESIPTRLDEEIRKVENALHRGEKYEGNVQVSISIPENKELSAEFERLMKMLPQLL
jgi:hypothetical protein